jgi:hypothetical protein
MRRVQENRSPTKNWFVEPGLNFSLIGESWPGQTAVIGIVEACQIEIEQKLFCRNTIDHHGLLRDSLSTGSALTTLRFKGSRQAAVTCLAMV